jgi:hypothetical protein
MLSECGMHYNVNISNRKKNKKNKIKQRKEKREQ